MFGNLGFSEILLLMVIFLLVFGAKRLPEIGSAMGKGIREFKKSMREVTDEIDRPVTPTPVEPRRLPSTEDKQRLS
jgi:sec-independent protein translocase protein TatA